MEESKALSKLTETTDLLVLLEDILNPSSIERLSQSSWSGLRITLRNARQNLQEAQSVLSKEFVQRARGSNLLNGATSSTVTNSNFTKNALPNDTDSSDLNTSEQSKVQITRRDLKATLEKFIDAR